MATYTPPNSAFPFALSDESLRSGQFLDGTPTELRYQIGSFVAQFAGAFALDINGQPTGGTITGITLLPSIGIAGVISGINISYADFFDPLVPLVATLFSGNDVFAISASAPGLGDTYRGFAGDDLFVVTGGGASIDGGDGFDTVRILPSPNFSTFGEVISGIELFEILNAAPAVISLEHLTSGATVNVKSNVDVTIRTGLFDDSVTGGGGDDFIQDSGFNGGDDIFRGMRGDDQLFGNDGNDKLFGGPGDDVVYGGTGNDRMEGGTGNDIYEYDSRRDVLVDAGGIDRVDASISIVLPRGIEDLYVTENVNGTGNGLANEMIGSAGSNRFAGLNGADTLNGRGGRDVLDGGLGNDRLIGEKGNDLLIGGRHRDIMTGGADKDVFDFNSVLDSGKTARTRDIITDFRHGIDDINLATIDANGSATGHTFKFLAAKGADFTGVKGQLHWYQENLRGTANDRTIVEGDINGDKRADFQIQLSGLKVLTAGDFIL